MKEIKNKTGGLTRGSGGTVIGVRGNRIKDKRTMIILEQPAKKVMPHVDGA